MKSWPCRQFAQVLFFLTCLVIVFPVALHAAEIKGTVTDQSGAAIPNATIEIRSGSSLVTTHSDRAGTFLVEVDGSRTTMTVSAPGFAVATLKCCQSREPIQVKLKPAPVGDMIIVMADRQPTRLAESASNTVLLTARDLDVRTATTLDDALRQVPGFTLFRRSDSLIANPTTQGPSARGLGANGAGRILVLQDGVPLNDPFGGWVYWDRTPRVALDHAEVLRGGGSNLYGSAALAGVIEMFTPAPANLVDLQVLGGGLGQRDVEAYASRQAGRWALSGTAESFGDDGAFVITPEDRGLADRPAELHFASGNIRLDRTFSDHLRFFTSGEIFAENRNNGTALQVNSTHLGQFVSGIDFNSGTNAISTRFYGTGQKLHQSFSSIAADRNSENLVRWQTVPSSELGFSSEWSRIFLWLRVTAGADARFIHGESDETSFLAGAANAFTASGGTDRIVGVFGQVSGAPTKKLHLSLGARLDHWTTDNGFSRTTSLITAATTANPVQNHNETAISPRFSGLYDLPGSLQLIASLYGGFRAPTLNELYRSFRLGNIITQANSQLRAEHLQGGEAGLRYVRPRYMLSSTFFREHLDDPVGNITLAATPALITRQRQNIGALEATGVDLEALFVLHRLQLRAGYEYVHSTVVSFGADPTLAGKRVPQTPAHVFTESVLYAAPHGFTFQLMARASSSQFDDDQNSFSLAPFSTFGVSFSKRLPQSELFAAVANLFNSTIETAATPVTTVAPGRVVTAGLRFRLGAR